MKGYDALPAERCGDCKYFRRHYTRASKGQYLTLEYGHCVHPRLKKRRAEEHCPHWCAKQDEASRSL